MSHSMTPWRQMVDMPSDRRDGRHVLLWTDAVPGGAFVCRWVEHLGRWMSRGPILVSDPKLR